MPEVARTAARIAELEQDNARLRRLLNQRDASGELRHRLRSTVGLLRGIIRTSARGASDLPRYVDQLLDRMDAVSRAQAAVDQHGSVRMHMLLADELLLYAMSEGERLTLSGPEVMFEPRAGQLMALAVHELAVNALEHGAIGTADGRLEVTWSVAGPGAPLVLEWLETGVQPRSRPAHAGFGTEVLTQMLPYELGAEAKLAPGSYGLCWTIRLPLTERVGRMVEA